MKKQEWKKLNLDYAGLVKKSLGYHFDGKYIILALDINHGIEDTMVIARVHPDNLHMIRYHELRVRYHLEEEKDYLLLHNKRVYLEEIYRFPTQFEEEVETP